LTLYSRHGGTIRTAPGVYWFSNRPKPSCFMVWEWRGFIAFSLCLFLLVTGIERSILEKVTLLFTGSHCIVMEQSGSDCIKVLLVFLDSYGWIVCSFASAIQLLLSALVVALGLQTAVPISFLLIALLPVFFWLCFCVHLAASPLLHCVNNTLLSHDRHPCRTDTGDRPATGIPDGQWRMWILMVSKGRGLMSGDCLQGGFIVRSFCSAVIQMRYPR